ncbi:MAG: OadG family transporter subunit [Sulfurovum sp.]
MEVNLVYESLKFMVLGMSVVAVFLIILVEVIKIQAKIINKYFPEKVAEVPTTSNNTTEENAHHVAAIVAAITEFRKK